MIIRAHVLGAALLLAAAACGGKQGGDSTTPSGGGGDGADTGGSVDPSVLPGHHGGQGEVVPPETMDDIRRRFDRKQTPISRCLSAAIDAKELPKSSRGKITLNVTIMPGGKAGEVKIVKASIESPTLDSCVIGKVKEIIFPEVPQPYPTSYTYGFEAM